MANIMQNRIDAVLKPDELQKMKDYISMLLKMLPAGGQLTLTEDEMGSMNSLDVDNKAFVEDAIMELRNNGAGIIPAFITPAQIQNDLTLFEQMDELLSLMNKVQKAAGYLLRIGANEAYGVSNAVYRFFQSAAEAGIPNAQSSYDKLRQRYKPKSGGNQQKPLE